MTILAAHLPQFAGELWSDLAEMMVQWWMRIVNFSFQKNVMVWKPVSQVWKRILMKEKDIKTLRCFWPTCFRAEMLTLQICKIQWCLVFQASYLCFRTLLCLFFFPYNKEWKQVLKYTVKLISTSLGSYKY